MISIDFNGCLNMNSLVHMTKDPCLCPYSSSYFSRCQITRVAINIGEAQNTRKAGRFWLVNCLVNPDILLVNFTSLFHEAML
jgi:hypothetical protein